MAFARRIGPRRLAAELAGEGEEEAPRRGGRRRRVVAFGRRVTAVGVFEEIKPSERRTLRTTRDGRAALAPASSTSARSVVAPFRREPPVNFPCSPTPFPARHRQLSPSPSPSPPSPSRGLARLPRLPPPPGLGPSTPRATLRRGCARDGWRSSAAAVGLSCGSGSSIAPARVRIASRSATRGRVVARHHLARARERVRVERAFTSAGEFVRDAPESPHVGRVRVPLTGDELGDMYSGVPTLVTARSSSRSSAFAMPKSPILTHRRFLERKTFAGFRSLWRTFLECTWSRASRSWTSQRMTASSGRGWPPSWRARVARDAALAVRHDDAQARSSARCWVVAGRVSRKVP